MTAFRIAHSLPGFRLRPATPWLSVAEDGKAVRVETPMGALTYDHLILATGSVVDLALRPELKNIATVAALWKERFKPPAGEEDERLANLPYLDEVYGFTPKSERDAWVSRVFAFNGLSVTSHGPHSTSISGHKHALPRVIRGVTRRLLLGCEARIPSELSAYRSNDLPIPDDFEQRSVEAAASADVRR